MALLLVQVCVLSVFAESTLDQIIAKVDYNVITESELAEAMQPSLRQIKENYPPEEWDQRIQEIRRQILNQMINEFVCLRFARDNEIEATDAEVEATILNLRENAGILDDETFKKELAKEGITLEELKRNLGKQTIVRRVLRSEIYSKIRVTETEIKEFYNANRDRYLSRAKVRVAVLMIDTENTGLLSKAAAERKIYEAWEKLKNGADFSELVKDYSDGPERESGGDIGFIEEGKVLPVVEKTAFQMSEGQFSEPLETGFGWVIVKVLEKVESGLKPLAEFRDELEMIIRESKVKDMEQEWFDRQRAMTFIELVEF